jgi:hypothetical protein
MKILNVVRQDCNPPGTLFSPFFDDFCVFLRLLLLIFHVFWGSAACVAVFRYASCRDHRRGRGEAVKKWDWLRARTAKTLENWWSRKVPVPIFSLPRSADGPMDFAVRDELPWIPSREKGRRKTQPWGRFLPRTRENAVIWAHTANASHGSRRKVRRGHCRSGRLDDGHLGTSLAAPRLGPRRPISVRSGDRHRHLQRRLLAVKNHEQRHALGILNARHRWGATAARSPSTPARELLYPLQFPQR